MSYKISVIGLGKLGSCMAAVYASKGHTVIGVDINERFVEAINNGLPPVEENGLADCITRTKDKLRATSHYNDAIKNSSISFIIVPTPSEDAGGFTAKYVQEVCKGIGRVLKDKTDYHLVVLTSTLLPGDCENNVIPVLEEFSGKKCGEAFGFCYSPEFIAIGSVVRDLLNPDFFLIGEYDKKSGDMLEDFYNSTSDNGAPSKRMGIKSAELAKISVNSFLTMKITYANMLAEIAENIPGVDVDKVTDAIGSDKRIGKHYLRGGLGYGGPCFPRDNRAFAYMAKLRGVEVPFAERTDQYNKSIVNRALKHVKEYVQKGASVGILGLSYKPGTYFAEESQAVHLAIRLSDDGYQVNVFEPCGYSHAQGLLDDKVSYCSNFRECVEKSQLLFLSNIDEWLKALPQLLGPSSKKIIIDPWRQFKNSDFSEAVVYRVFGFKDSK